MRDVAHARPSSAPTVDGLPVTGVDSFCTDQTKQTYEFNFRLPAAIASGGHHVTIALGRREFAPFGIEVV